MKLQIEDPPDKVIKTPQELASRIREIFPTRELGKTEIARRTFDFSSIVMEYWPVVPVIK